MLGKVPSRWAQLASCGGGAFEEAPCPTKSGPLPCGSPRTPVSPRPPGLWPPRAEKFGRGGRTDSDDADVDEEEEDEENENDEDDEDDVEPGNVAAAPGADVLEEATGA